MAAGSPSAIDGRSTPLGQPQKRPRRARHPTDVAGVRDPRAEIGSHTGSPTKGRLIRAAAGGRPLTVVLIAGSVVVVDVDVVVVVTGNVVVVEYQCRGGGHRERRVRTVVSGAATPCQKEHDQSEGEHPTPRDSVHQWASSLHDVGQDGLTASNTRNPKPEAWVNGLKPDRVTRLGPPDLTIRAASPIRAPRRTRAHRMSGAECSSPRTQNALIVAKNSARNRRSVSRGRVVEVRVGAREDVAR